MPRIRELTSAETLDRRLGGVFLKSLVLLGKKPNGVEFAKCAKFEEATGRRRLKEPSKMNLSELQSVIRSLNIPPEEIIKALYGRN